MAPVSPRGDYPRAERSGSKRINFAIGTAERTLASQALIAPAGEVIYSGSVILW
jgi:hemin uptake protein HemP